MTTMSIGTQCLATSQKAETIAKIDQQMKMFWSCSGQEIGQPMYKMIDKSEVVVGFSVVDQKICKIKVLKSSQDAQNDAECVEAVCEAAPINISDATVKDEHAVQFVKTKFFPRFHGEEVRDYLKTHHDKTVDSVLVHKIPLIATKRFPKFFNLDELRRADNLVAIQLPKGGEKQPLSDDCIRKIERLYASFADSCNESSISKEEIIRRAKEVSESLI